MSAYANLLAMLKSVASDPRLATDEGHDIMDAKGNIEVYVAKPRASEEDLLRAEEFLGFALPDLLRQIYKEVGNGGFGPGYGLYSLPTSDSSPSYSGDAVAEYKSLRTLDPNDPNWIWPDKLLPICTWGCGVDSCLDCSRPELPVIRYDPDADEAEAIGLISEGKTFEQWLRAWLNDEELFELNAT